MGVVYDSVLSVTFEQSVNDYVLCADRADWIRLNMRKSDLSKQGLVGGLDLLSLGVAAGRQQRQDGVLISSYDDQCHG